jgi:uncharacterized surface protein with fasciclin (FAS1) repeats
MENGKPGPIRALFGLKEDESIAVLLVFAVVLGASLLWMNSCRSRNAQLLTPQGSIAVQPQGAPVGRLAADNTVTLTGTAASGSQVEIMHNNRVIERVMADSRGAWQYSGRFDTPGTHALTARFENSAGKTVVSDPWRFAISADSTSTAPQPAAPALSGPGVAGGVASPPVGRLAPDNGITLSGIAAPGSLVDILYNNRVIATVQADPAAGAWEYQGRFSEPGTHTLAARVEDANGERVITTPWRFTVSADGEMTAAAPQESAPDHAAASPDSSTESDDPAQTPSSPPVVAELEGDDTVSDADREAAGFPSEEGTQGDADSAASDSYPVPGADADADADAATDAGATEPGDATDQEAQPGTDPSLLERLQQEGEFTTFLAAMDRANLTYMLSGDAPLTLFAPTDAAFNALPPDALDGWQGDTMELTNVLMQHIAVGRVTTELSEVQGTFPALNGNDLLLTPATPEEGKSALWSHTINGVPLARADLNSANGVLHSVDTVLIPNVIAPPVIDVEGVPTFTGRFLTVVGTGVPGVTVVLMRDDQEFGRIPVEADGTWLIAADIEPGTHRLVAWHINEYGLVRSASTPVTLIVE